MRTLIVDREKTERNAPTQRASNTHFINASGVLGLPWGAPMVMQVSNRFTRQGQGLPDPVTGRVATWRNAYQDGSNYVPGAYGMTVQAPPGVTPSQAGTDTAAAITSLISAGADLAASLRDPVKHLAVLEAKLKEAKARGAGSRKIAILTAQVEAAKHAAGIETESEQATRDWRNIGQSGSLVGIALGLGLLYWIVVSAHHKKRST